MGELLRSQLERQDLVDNCIYDLLRTLAPEYATIEWNTECINEVREAVQDVIVNKLGVCSDQEFYPYIKLRGKFR